MSRLLLFPLVILVSSCSTLGGKFEMPTEEQPKVQETLLQSELRNVSKPTRKPTVAVYQFTDQTGQKRQNSNV